MMKVSAIILIAMSSIFPVKQIAASGMDKVPSMPESRATTHVLPNGLTVIVNEDHSAPVASIQAWCATGSIHEGDWMGAGLSHILEHMLFKGTESRGAGEIAGEVQDQGGYINAYTSFDRTVYWIDVPSEGALTALSILADAMQNSTLPEEEYAKEQEVIRREFAMGFDDPNRQSSQLMLRTVFSESPFRHPVIGYLDVYNKLTRDDVMAYYKSRYVPNNLTFVVSGDINTDEVLKTLESAFQDTPREPLSPLYVASEPEQTGRRDAHEEFANAELTRLNLAWRIPGLDHPDTAALDTLGEILGSGRSSLLNRKVREEKRLAHQVSGGMFSLLSDGVFVVQAICDPANREAVETESLGVIRDIQENPPGEAELERAKRSILASQLSRLDTARGVASDLGSNWLLTKNLNFTRDYLHRVSSLTPDDITRVARTYLKEDKLNSTSLNPPGTLDQEENEASTAEASDVQKFVLGNGLTLLVREDPRLPLVVVNAVFRGGVLAETSGNNGITRLMARTLLKGTESRSAEDIAREIESVGGSISSNSGNNSFSVSAEVMTPDLPLAMEVVADVLKHPTFEESQIDLERQSVMAAIKAEDEQITSVARNVTRAEFFGPHPYGLRASGQTEAVKKLTREDLKAFHQERVTARNGVLAVFGDVKSNEVRDLAERWFGSLPPGKPLAAPANPDFPKGATEKKVAMDKNQSVLMFAFPGPKLLSEDYPAMELINSASNDLGSRFFNRIREDLGLAYFVGAGNLTGPVPGSQIFYLGTDPKKIDLVRKEFRTEIADLARSGLTAEELERAKKKSLGREAIQNQSNAAFAESVALDELLGPGYDAYKGRREKIEAVTIEDTRRVAGKYLDTEGYVTTVVGP